MLQNANAVNAQLQPVNDVARGLLEKSWAQENMTGP